MKILCVIPARSGSKGIKHKNTKLVNGKPMLAWSIEHAKCCKYENQMKIIVSTDSKAYAKIARKYGAETPFLRPPEISKDLSTDFECINHAVNWLEINENYIPDIVLHLRPTQPCRKVKDVDDALELFIKNRDNYDSLRSVIPVEKSPFKMYLTQNSELKPLFNNINNINEPYNQSRQVLPQAYLHNGYIDILNVSILKNNTISGNKILHYIMNKTDNIDIDYEDDLKNIKN